ncbi:MAG: arsenate reductase ArsC [Desulfobacterales bacterium]|jgi:arsenate reductase
MKKSKILFICVHNSGRSQMAEAYLRKLAGHEFDVESAGLEPANDINPLVVEVMKEEGIDISSNKIQSVFELFKTGKLYDHVVTVCDGAAEAKCPVFAGITKRWNWPFPDPAAVEGTSEEKLHKVREIRNMIKEKLIDTIEAGFE